MWWVDTYLKLIIIIVYLQLTDYFLSVQASAHTKRQDIGANIFIGNLDPEVDEKLLYDTFSAFGVILQTPKVFISNIYHLKFCFNMRFILRKDNLTVQCRNYILKSQKITSEESETFSKCLVLYACCNSPAFKYKLVLFGMFYGKKKFYILPNI